MTRDLHTKPFDDATQTKLALFRLHIEAWLAVFTTGYNPEYMPRTLNICDFFCGPGRDKGGKDGSPLVIMRSLRNCAAVIRDKALLVNVIFNDEKVEKVAELEKLLSDEGLLGEPFNVTFKTKDFAAIFKETYSTLKDGANLLLLDQNGVRHFTKQVFTSLLALRYTDTLVFTASSYVHRFKDAPEVERYLETKNIPLTTANYPRVHRAVVDCYRSWLPAGREYYLIPFSLKKGSNIYGLTYACGHARGAEKFLEAAWRTDSARGEANFNLDADGYQECQLSLLEEYSRPLKLNVFEKHLREEIVCGKLMTTGAIYKFALREGCLAKHAKAVLTRMEQECLIEVDLKAFARDSLKNPKPIKVLAAR